MACMMAWGWRQRTFCFRALQKPQAWAMRIRLSSGTLGRVMMDDRRAVQLLLVVLLSDRSRWTPEVPLEYSKQGARQRVRWRVQAGDQERPAGAGHFGLRGPAAV